MIHANLSIRGLIPVRNLLDFLLSTVVAVPSSTAVPAPPTNLGATNRFGPRWYNWLKRWFGTPSQRRLARGALQIDHIRHWEKKFTSLTDQEVMQHGLQLKGRARGGESLDQMLPEAFGLTCVAAWRRVRLRPFDVQLAAGVVLHHGALAEVATGEGKTLIATLPVSLNALAGKGVHVTTVNDYLAQRDGEWTSAIYNALGLSAGVLQMHMPDADRVEAYKADITYGTSSEFGFDFLRDRLKIKNSATGGMPFWMPWTAGAKFTQPTEQKVQRNHYYALVDEADNIFIDEARTPLIISMATRPAKPEEQVVYQWADGVAQTMVRDQHFYLDEKKHKIELTDSGKQVIRYSNPPMGPNSHAMDKLHEHIERALHAHHRFRRDQHYLVEDNKVIIIDEATGRRMPDRHWREGLHQAVEAKEKVLINYAADHAAQITYQSYFKKYEKLAGMSGTAVQNFFELLRVYWLWVVQAPTNKPSIRQQLPDQVFPTEDAKFDAAVAEIVRLHRQGRPILVGTRTVDKSEILSARLKAAGIPHQVLNAKPGSFDREADIIAQAGRSASVTVATNMAGRGTDILLGGNAETLAWARFKDKYKQRHHVPPDEWERAVEEMDKETNVKADRQRVRDAGGLHVIGLERHEAARIDRQLIGRAARQGDPGSCQFLVSLEDDILEGLGPEKQSTIQKVGRQGGNRNWNSYVPLFFKAQRRVESRHYRQRVDLMVYERNRQEILKDLGADPYVD